jgi:UDP-N-acetylmuramate--alanine ligase
MALGISLEKGCDILSRFTGIKRRMELVGKKDGIVVIDDFAHNPDKVAASLSALKEFPGRLQIFFQPHGYGFLKLVWQELARTFADHLTPGDQLYFVEPLYMGGTVDRSIGSAQVVEELKRLGVDAHLSENREAVKAAILADLKPADRLIVMGARDDSLSDFARDLYKSIP